MIRRFLIVTYINNENGLKGLFEMNPNPDENNKILVASGNGNAFDNAIAGFSRALEHVGIEFSMHNIEEEVSPQMMFGKIDKYKVLVDLNPAEVDEEGRVKLILEDSRGIVSNESLLLEDGITKSQLEGMYIIIHDGYAIMAR